MILFLIAAFADTPVEQDLQAIAIAEWRRSPVAELQEASSLEDVQVVRAKVRALGRLRDADALPILLELSRHDDPGVRAEVAFALGLTPDSAPAIRRWLATEKPATQLVARLTDQYRVRWQLIEALGRSGDRSDVPGLVALLDEKWPYDEAAARALLRLQRRKVEVGASREALAAQVLRGDPRTVEATASSLARIGLDGLDEATRSSLTSRIRTAPTDLSRAELVRALKTPEAVRAGLEGGPLSMRAALIAAAELELAATGLSLQRLAELAASSDRWIAAAAQKALLSHDRPTLEAMVVSTDHAYDRALLLDLLEVGDADVAQDEEQPWPIRAAHATHLDDPTVLIALATSKMHPAVQTAAAARLMELEVPRETLVGLLESADTGVREAAIEMLEGKPTTTLVEEIILSVRVEKDGEVLRAGFERLADYHRQSARSVRAERFLISALKRGAAHRSKRVRDSARSLAATLGVDVPEPTFDTTERELILPDGTVTTTTGDLPKLLEVLRIVGATVHTEKGPIELVLRPDIAPMAVYNFASLARSGFYDGQLWHRVVPGFVVQGGCPRGDGWGGPGWTIPDEVSDRPFVLGALGMARSDRDTGGSQFFVMTGSARFLDGDYTWFGTVRDGDHVTRHLQPGDRILRVEIHNEAIESTE